ncbi:MAG: hypothetical protein WCA01_01605 [Burkholderiales bacterium]
MKKIDSTPDVKKAGTTQRERPLRWRMSRPARLPREEKAADSREVEHEFDKQSASLSDRS